LWMRGDHGWIGFSKDARGNVEAEHLGERPDHELELAAWLFSPFREQILAARRLYLLPSDDLVKIDLHALRFEEHHVRSVVYGLDLPNRAPAAFARKRAVVVGDPTGSLKGARAEAEFVHGYLGELGLEKIDALDWPDATRAKVIAAINGADWLHYAGHASYSG